MRKNTVKYIGKASVRVAEYIGVTAVAIVASDKLNGMLTKDLRRKKIIKH